MNALEKRLYDGGAGITMMSRLNPRQVSHEVIYQSRKLFTSDEPTVFSVKFSEYGIEKMGYHGEKGKRKFLLVYIGRLVRRTRKAEKKNFVWIWAMATWKKDVYLYGEKREAY